jgi:putative spermidine/putrescine transport system ATP-binding protein
MSSVTLDSLTKRYGSETAVDGLDLTIRDGEVLGIVGPSGCGKTTTLRTIAGFETPTEGCVRFDDRDVTHVPPEQRNVGLVFQSYALFDTMSVRENVAFGLKMRDVPEAERHARSEELLEMLGIGEMADRQPVTLSGGQQQRVGLARALAIEPNILLLDEPMTGLDATLKDRLQREIGSLLSELETTALYVTHDQSEAMQMCDRIAVMNNGIAEQVDTPAAVYESPETAFVADFIGTSNLLEATAIDGALDFGFQTVDAPFVNGLRGEVTVSVRPSAFRLGEGPLDVSVESVDYLGERRRIRGRLPNEQSVVLESTNGYSPTAGETISVDLDTSGLHVIGAGQADG